MFYELKLNADRRVMGYTYPASIHATVFADKKPPENFYDYLYIESQYIYDPLPQPEPIEPTPTPDVWDELDAAYQAGYNEGYAEGVNSVYDE